MSKNLEIANRLESAVFGGDQAGIRAVIHPDFVLHSAPRHPYGGRYDGVEGFLVFIDRLMGHFDFEKLERTGTYSSENGDMILEFHLRGTAKSTGVLLDTSLLEKWEFKDGKIIAVTPHYFD